jgi:hypothetical protein
MENRTRETGHGKLVDLPVYHLRCSVSCCPFLSARLTRAVLAKSVLGLVLWLLSSAWLRNTQPLSGPAEPRSRANWQERVTPAPAPACNRLLREAHIPQGLRLSVSVARQCADDALPARHRKPMSKRLRRRFGVLPAGVLANGKRLVADIPSASQGVPPDGWAPDRTGARAPPAPHQPA